MKTLLFAAALGSAVLMSNAANAAPINVVVAENFYGDAVQAIGGTNVNLTAIINSPDADPHDYEPTPSTAKAIADAGIVVYNGIDYDAWMDKLIAASKAPKRTVINVATLLKRKAGDNPHLWYDPASMPALADALVKALSAADPAGAAGYAERAKTYKAQLAPITTRIAAVKAKYAKAPVTATEPVFGYMSDAMGLDMRNQSFQRAIQNETEPSAKDTAAMEADLKGAKVKVLFYNSQVTDTETEHLLSLAKAAKVPVVGVTETRPADKATYIEWMLSEIDATEKALGGQAQ
jgi:zinc/manganese transport system substrate-binding protein